MPNLTFPFLSIDPGSQNIGWSLFGPGPTYIASSTFLLPEVPAEERIPLVGPAVNEIITRCPYRPTAAVIEIPNFIATFAKPHIVVFFRAVGIVEHATQSAGLQVFRVYPNDDEKTGVKDQRNKRYMDMFRRYPLTQDEADAFCIGWDFIVKNSPQPPMP